MREAMTNPILSTIPAQARYLHLSVGADLNPEELLQRLHTVQQFCLQGAHVLGLSAGLSQGLGLNVAGLREFAGIAGSQISLNPLTSGLWLWLRGDDAGSLFHQQRKVLQILGPAFGLQQVTAAHSHRGGRDLSGFVDGTENPQGDDARACALRSDGSSLVAVQRWRHCFDDLQRYTEAQQDLLIGRRQSDDVELDDAPASAHVKRTAQEDFEPAAFVLRRSMPWVEQTEGGLYFTAFATELTPFEAQLRRMTGAEDGILDSLFKFSEPEFTAYYWCPRRCLSTY